MLKPVSDTLNIDDLFRCCKRLSYYQINNEPAYLIPKDFFKYAPKINSLKYAFSDILFPNEVNIDVFKELTGTLNLEGIFFQCYWEGSASKRIVIENVFRTNRVSATTKAFCIIDDINTSNDRITEQYITFNNIFDSMYASSTYNGNANFKSTFRGYSAISVQHENPKTLTDAQENMNYETT